MQTIMQRAIRLVDAGRGARAHGKELVYLTGLEGKCQGGTGTSSLTVRVVLEPRPSLSGWHWNLVPQVLGKSGFSVNRGSR